MTDTLYLVLNGPFSLKPQSHEMICLVAPIVPTKAPRLITTAHKTHVPQKGQVLDLRFKDEPSSIAKWRVVEFDPQQSHRVQEFYHTKHGTLVTKNDWSEPVLQRFYQLEQLVELTSQDQRVLYGLLKRQPHVLLFQDFKSLPRLTYQQYEAVCKYFDITTPFSSEVVTNAQHCLVKLESFYMHNVAISRQVIEETNITTAALDLLESTGLAHDKYGEYSWELTQRFESALREQLARFSTGHSIMNTYIYTRAEKSFRQEVTDCFHSRLVVLGTGPVPACRVDMELESIIRWAKENGTYIDFSRGYLIHTIQARCTAGCYYLFLHNVHLISIPALVGLLRLLPDTIDGLVLYYDCNYRSQITRFLNDFAKTQQVSVEWQCKSPESGLMTIATQLNLNTLYNGYSFAVPISWMSPAYRQRFIEFYWKVRSEAVLLVTTTKDFNQLTESIEVEFAVGRLEYNDPDLNTMEFGEPITQTDDIFGGLLYYQWHQNASACAASVAAEPDLLARNYNYTELWRMRVAYVGQCKYRPKYVFYYTTVPLKRDTLYKLVSHAGSNVFINSDLELLQLQ
jgi:hypothetical protein